MISITKLDRNNESHIQVLRSISNSTTYLGNLEKYNLVSNDKFYNNDYIVNDNGIPIGYLGITNMVETTFGNTVSLYYGIINTAYGHGYGKQIVQMAIDELKKCSDVDILIASVDIYNTQGNKVVNDLNFSLIMSDEENNLYKYDIKNR